MEILKIDPDNLPTDNVVVITTDKTVLTARLYKDQENKVIAVCSSFLYIEYSPQYYISKYEFFKSFNN